jgi:hypothetical protein
MVRTLPLPLLLLLVVLPFGCDRDATSGGDHHGGHGQVGAAAREDDPERAKVVARVDDHTITVGELSDALNRQNPYIRMRYASAERKKEYLKNLVRLEVLSAEAHRRGLHRDPDVQRRLKRVMVDRLMERLHKELVKFEDVSDEDARAYYDKKIDQYKQPAKVRVSQVVVPSEAAARKVMAEARKKPGDIRHFAELVAKRSIDQASKARRGDLGYFDREAQTIPAAVVEDAFAIAGLWKLGGPVKVGDNWVVLLKTGERPAVDRTFDKEKDRIKNKIFNERRFKAVNDFVDQLQAKAKVEIDEANLRQVKLEVKDVKKVKPEHEH